MIIDAFVPGPNDYLMDIVQITPMSRQATIELIGILELFREAIASGVAYRDSIVRRRNECAELGILDREIELMTLGAASLMNTSHSILRHRYISIINVIDQDMAAVADRSEYANGYSDPYAVYDDENRTKLVRSMCSIPVYSDLILEFCAKMAQIRGEDEIDSTMNRIVQMIKNALFPQNQYEFERSLAFETTPASISYNDESLVAAVTISNRPDVETVIAPWIGEAYIDGCPVMGYVHLTAGLRVLEIRNCPALQGISAISADQSSTLSVLVVESCHGFNIAQIPAFTGLSVLDLTDMDMADDELNLISGLLGITALTIKNNPLITSIRMIAQMNPSVLNISGCPNIVDLDEISGFDDLDMLVADRCNIVNLPTFKPRMLTAISLRENGQFSAFPNSWNLLGFTSIRAAFTRFDIVSHLGRLANIRELDLSAIGLDRADFEWPQSIEMLCLDANSDIAFINVQGIEGCTLSVVGLPLLNYTPNVARLDTDRPDDFVATDYMQIILKNTIGISH